MHENFIETPAMGEEGSIETVTDDFQQMLNRGAVPSSGA
jgi:hypothetical protein